MCNKSKYCKTKLSCLVPKKITSCTVEFFKRNRLFEITYPGYGPECVVDIKAPFFLLSITTEQEDSRHNHKHYYAFRNKSSLKKAITQLNLDPLDLLIKSIVKK